MSLLVDLQNAAVDKDTELATILRKVKLLAARLGNVPLADWVQYESGGYPVDVPIPSYRVWELEVVGHFLGPFGAQAKNAPVPLALLPENIRDSYRHYKCRQSIAAMESFIAKPDVRTVHVSTGNLALALGERVFTNMNCVHASAQFGINCFEEAINTVRNRVLDLSIALWKEFPDLGGATPESSVPGAAVSQIVNMTVLGGVANIVGTMENSEISSVVDAGDFDALKAALLENDVPEEDIEELQKALKGDPPKLSSSQAFGPKVSSWISKMVLKAASGSWSVSLGAAGNILAELLKNFYGL